MGTPGRDGRDRLPGRDGLPGTNEANGRDGRDRAQGPSAGLDLEEIRDIVKLVAQEECRRCTYPPVASCPGWSVDRPATSCHSILDCNPSTPSGYYWITNGARPHAMYCYMEADKCGVRGVMRVAHIDMRISSVDGPAPLTQYQLHSGERVCGFTNTVLTSCDSVIFPTHNLSYQYVCGRAAVHSGTTREMAMILSMMPMCLDCQSHTGLRMDATIFGHMLEATRKVYLMAVTVLVQPTQDSAHRYLWGRTFTVNLPLATLLPSLPHLKVGTPTTPSGMERTVTLEAVAVTTLLLHGSGGHSRRRPQRT